MFDHVLLEPEQKELLVVLVEASRNVPRENRQKFCLVIDHKGKAHLIHPGLPSSNFECFDGDLEQLAAVGLIDLAQDADGRARWINITPPGLLYYREYKERLGRPEEQTETTAITYLDSQDFRRRFSKARDKWAEAARMLWTEKAEANLSIIGHHCREAIQEFATVLVETHKPPDADPNVAHEIKRVGAVLTHLFKDRASTDRTLIEAAMNYWEKCSGIVQRLEHSGQREKEPLVWDDARSVVFQTAFLMHEIDRLISRRQ